MAYNCCIGKIESTMPTAGERADMDVLPETVQECLINKSLCTLMSMRQKNRPKTRSRLENALGPCTVVVPYANPLDVLAAANKLSTQPTPSVSIPHAKKRVYTVLKTTVKKAYQKRLSGRNFALAPQQSDIEKDIMYGATAWLQSDPEGTEESLIDEFLQRCEKEDQDNSNIVLKHLQETGKVTLDESGRISFILPSAGVYLQEKISFQLFSVIKGLKALSPSNSDPSHNIIEPRPILHMITGVMLHLYELSPTSRPSTVTEFLKVIQLVCNTFFTVPPYRVFAMNMKYIKHRQVKDMNDDQDSKKNESNKTESESISKTKMRTELAIGVQPRVKNIREQIPITPEGLTGIDVSVQTGSSHDKQCTGTMKTPDKRLRAVGQCKGFIEVFRNRLTVAARGRNAILVPASEQEEKDMISKVAEWVNSDHRCSSDTHGVAGAASADTTHHTVTQLQLQQELINICVGKVRHLTALTITELLQKAGFITVDDEQSVTYQLPTYRDKKLTSWQEDTIKAAAESCRCTGMLRKAFPRRKGKDGNKMPKQKNEKCNPAPETVTLSSAAAPYGSFYDDLDDDVLAGYWEDVLHENDDHFYDYNDGLDLFDY